MTIPKLNHGYPTRMQMCYIQPSIVNIRPLGVQQKLSNNVLQHDNLAQPLGRYHMISNKTEQACYEVEKETLLL